MKKLLWALLAVGLVGSGCEPLDDPGGGGGGVTDVIFGNGYVFVRNDQIWMANSPGPNDETVPASQLTNSGENHSPSLSPDGRTVVFVQGSESESSLMLVNTVVDAANQVRVLFPASGNQRNFRYPVFTPDGEQVVFAYEDNTGGSTFSAIGVVNADGSGFRSVVGSATESYTSPSLQPAGGGTPSLQVYAALGGVIGSYDQIVAIDLATGDVTPLVTDLSPATAIADRVVVSPDGTRVAFAGRVPDTAARIFVADLDTEVVTQITEHVGDASAADSSPTWVSNTRVGFSAQVANGESIYTVPATPPAAGPGAGTLEVPSAVQPWYGEREAEPVS